MELPTNLTPDQIAAGRAWLAELAWRDLDADAILDRDQVSDAEVVQALARTYSGGWSAFLRDDEALVVDRRDEVDSIATIGDDDMR